MQKSEKYFTGHARTTGDRRVDSLLMPGNFSGRIVRYLQKVLGHASLQMTQKYVDADEEDLMRAHRTLSPLESVKAKR
jgi:integrase